MDQKFVIKSPELGCYFSGIGIVDGYGSVVFSKDKNAAKVFNLYVEAAEWFKKLFLKDKNVLKYNGNDITWEIALVTICEGQDAFKEIMTWNTTQEA